jgi:hypothetical protein
VTNFLTICVPTLQEIPCTINSNFTKNHGGRGWTGNVGNTYEGRERERERERESKWKIISKPGVETRVNVGEHLKETG